MKWFRLEHDLVFNAKAQSLPPVLFKHWINLLCLASRNEEHRGFLPDMDKISFALRMRPERARIILEDLQSRGFLESCSDKFGTSSVQVHDWDSTQLASDNSALRKQSQRIKKIAEKVTGQERDRTASDTDTDTDTPIVPVNGDGVGDRFAEFWRQYPKKVGKAAALKSWKRIKPGIDLTQKILAQVVDAKTSEQWRKENGQYIPHPATWLNEGRWDDEPTEITIPLPVKQERIWKTSEYL